MLIEFLVYTNNTPSIKVKLSHTRATHVHISELLATERYKTAGHRSENPREDFSLSGNSLAYFEIFIDEDPAK